METATGAPARRHQRNARGQGARLTGDIVSGALAVIEREGSAGAVTLRAVAREVGIAAPSIYAHFPDRDAILKAVIAQIFDELAAAIRQGTDAAGADPVARLIAGCEAYVSFGLADPARYGVLFNARRMASQDYEAADPPGPDGRPALAQGADAFALLVTAIEDCVNAGVSASTNPAPTPLPSGSPCTGRSASGRRWRAASRGPRPASSSGDWPSAWRRSASSQWPRRAGLSGRDAVVHPAGRRPGRRAGSGRPGGGR